jgi:hypothetical protein
VLDPVLIAVLRNASGPERLILEQLHAQTPWNGDEPTLQVMDSATWDALTLDVPSNLVKFALTTSRVARRVRNPTGLTGGKLRQWLFDEPRVETESAEAR